MNQRSKMKKKEMEWLNQWLPKLDYPVTKQKCSNSRIQVCSMRIQHLSSDPSADNVRIFLSSSCQNSFSGKFKFLFYWYNVTFAVIILAIGNIWLDYRMRLGCSQSVRFDYFFSSSLVYLMKSKLPRTNDHWFN